MRTFTCRSTFLYGASISISRAIGRAQMALASLVAILGPKKVYIFRALPPAHIQPFVHNNLEINSDMKSAKTRFIKYYKIHVCVRSSTVRILLSWLVA